MRRLRLQWIGILVLAVVLPLLPAAFAARELFRRSLDPLLASGLREGADAGMAVARDVIEADKVRWLDALRAGAARETLDVAPIEGLPRVADGDTAGRALGELRLLAGPEVHVSDSAAVLLACVRGSGGAPVWLQRALPDTLALRAAALARGARLLQTLRRERVALLRGLQATFLVVYLAMASAVLGLGLWLTSRLTRPLDRLARGIDRIAAGDFATRVPVQGGADVAELMRHFNTMAGRLQTQQAELARLERVAAWRQMARFLAHEIKNPLTPIQLAAEQMRDAYGGDDPAYRRLVNESAAIIQEEVLGMRNLVVEFSQFARLPALKPERVEPADLARELVAIYGEAGLAVRLPAAGALALWCDRDQLKRVLVNLIDNARAAQQGAGRGEPVELSFERTAAGGALLRVRDHGPGVADDRKRRVFEPDYTTKHDGMGLGLAIVESIVLDHGGSIQLLDAQGGGAIFELTLPAAESTGGPEV